MILKPRGCQVTKLYLCISSLLMASCCCFLADFIQGTSGYIVFVFVYGASAGAHTYIFKMYAFDLARSRNFSRIWPLFQFLQGLGLILGMPLLSNNFSGVCLLLASVSLILGDRVKQHLRALKKHQEHVQRYHQGQQSEGGQVIRASGGTSDNLACQSFIIHHDECCGHAENKHRNEYSDEDDEDEEDEARFKVKNCLCSTQKHAF